VGFFLPFPPGRPALRSAKNSPLFFPLLPCVSFFRRGKFFSFINSSTLSDPLYPVIPLPNCKRPPEFSLLPYPSPPLPPSSSHNPCFSCQPPSPFTLLALLTLFLNLHPPRPPTPPIPPFFPLDLFSFLSPLIAPPPTLHLCFIVLLSLSLSALPRSSCSSTTYTFSFLRSSRLCYLSRFTFSYRPSCSPSFLLDYCPPCRLLYFPSLLSCFLSYLPSFFHLAPPTFPFPHPFTTLLPPLPLPFTLTPPTSRPSGTPLLYPSLCPSLPSLHPSLPFPSPPFFPSL